MNDMVTNKRIFQIFGSALILIAFNCLPAIAQSVAADKLINEPVDISPDFRSFTNTYFLADTLADFDPQTASGHIEWQRNRYYRRMAFNNELAVLQPFHGVVFPDSEYATNPVLPFSLQFVSPRTVRIRMNTGIVVKPEVDSLMLVRQPPDDRADWRFSRVKDGYRYTNPFGETVTITKNPWHIVFRDASGRIITSTDHKVDNDSTFTPIVPFGFVRRSSDYSRSVCASFKLSEGEKIFGLGESFTRLDKRGQKVVLWTDDANGVQNPGMYKPIPFFMSSRGYGMFMHTSTPITCDIGHSYDGVNALMIGDDQLDLFVFLGNPKQILNEYTNLTGKSPMPPLWSFGFWMSRITYYSEQQVREVAAKLRKNKIPADVIHIDTGWFETDWRNNYKFSAIRFPTPGKMLSDLKKDGFHISLWQLPYFTPKNTLFPEILKKGLYVKDAKGNLPYEDAILDFSNPATVKWYQDKLAGLLRMGVGAIKVDFGEAAPPNGIYYDGRTGFYEHNLYPLRYNKAAADITYKITGNHIIWARSAWAGSQRYPIHWGGDAANTNNAMAATLRGGLSFGLSGFSFWSHDMGGFVQTAPAGLYRRWVPFGMLTSHSRAHGTPPTEPWAYGKQFMDEFRRADNLKYRLMPYVYAQAKYCSEHGLPMTRALFIEYPDDPGSWLIEDEYLFGSDMLVAPLMKSNETGRNVYLPAGTWIDYQTKKVYQGGWHHIEAGEIPIVLLVRNGSVIPHIKLAQSTVDMDWSHLELDVFATDTTKAKGLVCLPTDQVLREVNLTKRGNTFYLVNDPLAGKVSWKIDRYKNYRY